MAYKLDIPPTSLVHPVFHVSQLKKSHGTVSVAPSLPANTASMQFPEKILQHRWTVAEYPVEEGLVKWSAMPPSLATWEPFESLRQQFPGAPAWGHAGSEGWGNVSSPARQPTKEVNKRQSSRPSQPSVRVSGPEWL